MDKNITRIINKALDGNDLTHAEIVELFSVGYLTEEAFAIQLAGRRFTEELCDGEAEIHAHIGLDATPCPNDCKFCSFAASARIFKGRNEFTEVEVLANAREFKEAGVNAVYLVTTETYDKEKFLHMATLVRDELEGAIPLVANIHRIAENFRLGHKLKVLYAFCNAVTYSFFCVFCIRLGTVSPAITPMITRVINTSANVKP